MTRLDDCLDFLFGRINYERTSPVTGAFKLARMTELLRRLGDPQSDYPIVHIAGSKGKGSTAFMIASILAEQDRTCGLYTSPHLHDLEERIRINGDPCSAQQLCDLVDCVQPIALQMDAETQWGSGPTFFELTTAMAFLHFQQQDVAVAVIEVGLGGRLDSTNVCQPACTVITSISLDHTQLLGNTLEEIAYEKAGIVKPGVPLICGCPPQHPAHAVIRERATEVGAPAYFVERDFEFNYRPSQHGQANEHDLLDFRCADGMQSKSYVGLPVTLLGAHQAANTAVAVATVTELTNRGWEGLDERAIRAGLSRVSCPARVEIIRRDPLIVVDAAHNVASVAALRDVLDSQLRTPRRRLVFGTSRDKDIAGMLSVLLPGFDQVVFTQYQNNPRAADPAHLATIVQGLELSSKPAIQICADPEQACQAVLDGANDQEAIVVTGSFYLVAEARHVLAQRGTGLVTQT